MVNIGFLAIDGMSITVEESHSITAWISHIRLINGIIHVTTNIDLVWEARSKRYMHAEAISLRADECAHKVFHPSLYIAAEEKHLTGWNRHSTAEENLLSYWYYRSVWKESSLSAPCTSISLLAHECFRLSRLVMHLCIIILTHAQEYGTYSANLNT